MDRVTTTRPSGSWYELRVQGRLDQRWTAWLAGMTITPDGPTTVISGPVPDQPALHGLLARIRDLGVPLISVHQVGPPDRFTPTAPRP